MIAAPYSAQLRAERFIAAGRVVLAACALLAAFTAVPEILQAKPRVDAAFLGLYAVYAVSVAAMVWRAPRPLVKARLITHIIDVFIFAAMYISEHHLASGFFVFFVFSLLSATLR
jgi:chromate transport protein ChrA